MSSIIPEAVAAGVWYHLARRGITTTTVWLSCNLLDTFRALRLIRPNGRAVGQRTRRRAMRDSLICWVSFILVQQLGGIPDKLLGWLPIYSLLRSIAVAGFLLARVSASETIYINLIQPTLREYEAPIDLSIELVSSVILLVYHFTLQYPLIRVQSISAPYISKLASLLKTFKGSPAPTVSLGESIIDLTQVDYEDQEIIEITDSQLHAPTPSSSKIQHLIEACEKRSPTRPTTVEHSRLHSTMTGAARNVESARADNTNRAAPSTAPRPATQSTTRVPSRTATSQPRVPVKASQDTHRQPIVQTTASLGTKPKGVLADLRPVSTANSANIARTDPPLVKAKSDNHLKSTKPYVTDITATRPIKSAPTRRLAANPHPGDDPNSPRAKKLAHAVERAREIRERRRREPGVTPGEKRPPPSMSVVDAPGSKRTRISVVRG